MKLETHFQYNAPRQLQVLSKVNNGCIETNAPHKNMILTEEERRILTHGYAGTEIDSEKTSVEIRPTKKG